MSIRSSWRFRSVALAAVVLTLPTFLVPSMVQAAPAPKETPTRAPTRTPPTATPRPTKPAPTPTQSPTQSPTPAPTQTPPPTATPPISGTPNAGPGGYDISYPQCGQPYPASQAFGIVGANGGLAYTANPCLAGEFAWALKSSSTSQAHASFYLNTGNPGPRLSQHWPASGTTAPQFCDGSGSPSCAYDYGWFASRDSLADALSATGLGATSAPWWLDVETENSWTYDTAANAADLQGAVAYLVSAGVSTIGIYSTSYQWGLITGAAAPSSAVNAPFAALLNWEAGALSADDAPGFCSRTITGGPVKFVQYSGGSVDADYMCF